MWFRYPREYPNQPLVLNITSTKGLTASDARSLSKLLNSASAGHARDGVVAGFSIADACQEFLLTKNNPEAAKIDRMVCISCGMDLVQPQWSATQAHMPHSRLTHRQMALYGTACLRETACLKQKRHTLLTPLTKLLGARAVRFMAVTCLATLRCQKPGQHRQALPAIVVAILKCLRISMFPRVLK